jgi:phage terminase small subunit
MTKPDTLRPKQQRFIEEYLIDFNATQAAIRAGYSKDTAKVIGCENLTKPAIQAALSEEKAKLRARVEVTQEDVANELRKIGFQDIRDAVQWGSSLEITGDDGEVAVHNGVSLINSDEITADTAAAIAEVSQTKDGVKIKMHDKRAALVDLGKHLGMFEGDKDRAGDVHIHFDGLLKDVL